MPITTHGADLEVVRKDGLSVCFMVCVWMFRFAPHSTLSEVQDVIEQYEASVCFSAFCASCVAPSVE